MEHISNGFAKRRHPNCTHQGEEHFVADITDGTVIGFRSFDFQGPHTLTLETRGDGSGAFEIFQDLEGKVIGKIFTSPTRDWQTNTAPVIFAPGAGDLYIRFKGRGTKELRNICFQP